jgi:hypothetical protein
MSTVTASTEAAVTNPRIADFLAWLEKQDKWFTRERTLFEGARFNPKLTTGVAWANSYWIKLSRFYQEAELAYRTELATSGLVYTDWQVMRPESLARYEHWLHPTN